MKLPFFSRRVRFFGNVAIMILCAVFFLVPFAFRGARMSVRSVRNDVADWLPADFPETKELDWFQDHFMGSQFVVVSWPGCHEEDPRFQLLVDKLRAESLETMHDAEAHRAHELGDRKGLHTTGDYHEDWGSGREKWLMGDHDRWYYITQEGKVYQWSGQSNLMGWISRGTERMLHGKNRAEGKQIAQFGEPENNIYYRDPRRLSARFFEGITTGPELFDQLAGPEGSLLRGRVEENEGAALDARILAHQRLTGIVFGPTPRPGFDWSTDQLWQELSEDRREAMPNQWELIFEDYLDEVIERDFDGDRQAFLGASSDVHLEHWMRVFDRLRVRAPPRQTCIIVTLNSDVAKDLSRVVGRPVLGKPRGRILELATAECGIPADELHLGGPPVDNVAIDEEGTITLVRLVTLSIVVGIVLAFMSFRSLNVTFMVFFIGSVSAVTSMGIVWYLGDTPDAVLMSMPALVYVLGLSGAVHIVNYYRESCHTSGPRGASEAAVRVGWFPCTLAAFTTSLGLISLYASNLIPIKKFGLFSALGTMATVLLLFTYLPAALQIWPPGYKKKGDSEAKAGGFYTMVGRFWEIMCEAIIRRHKIVAVGCCVLLLITGWGLFRIETSVQLLKLFDDDAKVITDYEWLEENLGRLVPMELVVRVDKDAQYVERDGTPINERDFKQESRQLIFLERMELASRIRIAVEETFGDDGSRIVGNGLSTDVFVLPGEVNQFNSPLAQERRTISGQIESRYDDLLQTGTLRVDPITGEELWRISLRLGAFNDVDYGVFVYDLRRVVEPILTAYRYRNRILDSVYDSHPESPQTGRVLLLGWSNPSGGNATDGNGMQQDDASQEAEKDDSDTALIEVDQTELFCKTLGELLMNRGFAFDSRPSDKRASVVVPEMDAFAPLLDDPQKFAEYVEGFDCVVLIREHEKFDRELIEDHANVLVDATGHEYRRTGGADSPSSLIASDIRNDPDHAEYEDTDVAVTYTGIVPIVYKAQRTLLRSLMDSILLAFVMIALVMMILLRDWKRRVSLGNIVNVPGGMISMLPNVFPVVLIFGIMGHRGVEVDIGSMMTASVAMGIAVDDTIHFMNWFRRGIRQGLDRLDAIRLAYRRVATAMTQTTLIGGFGLSVFALSTFEPTKRFGILMLTLLFAALIGDLIFLPALLASPLGKFFCPKKDSKQESKKGKNQRSAEAHAGQPNVDAVKKRGTVGTPHAEQFGGDGAKKAKKAARPPDI